MYNDQYFDQAIDRKNTNCEKWDDPKMLPPGGIPLWVADMDFPCPPPIVEAVRKRAEHPCFGYNIEDPRDAAALCDFWRRRHGVSFLPEETRMLPCVITGLKTCVRAFTREGDGVAVFTPVYGPFYESIEANGRKVLRVPLIRDEDTGRYRMNLKGMEEALQSGAKLIMLCNPHNPVSRCWTEEELTGLCGLAEKYSVPMVSDEIHADFVYPPRRFVSILNIPVGRERAVMLCAASKTFNIAGLQQASLVCKNEEMRRAVQNQLTGAGAACGNTFALAATRAAYTKCDDWLDGLISYLDGSRALVAEWTQEYVPKAKLTPIEATYLAWLDLRAYGKTCAEIARSCMENKVALTGGTFFGIEGEGFMRVNFACPRDMLREGMKRLGRAMKEDE